MGVHTTDAVVLRRYPFRETSVTVTCLTERFGRLKGLVKGLRAQPSRHRSAMEPLTINRIVFYDTRGSPLHLISQCDLLVAFATLPRDVETMRVAAQCAELVDTVLPLEEPQPAVYHLLRDTLERLALGPGDLRSLRIHFIARLLRLAGFQPQLDECTGCGRRLEGAGSWTPPLRRDAAVSTAGWSARQGGLLCPRCLHQDPKAEPLTPQILETMEALLASDSPISLEGPIGPTFDRRLSEFLRWRLDRPLKTLTA